jgi:hypothetical protein
MDGLFLACAFFGALVLFVLAAVFEGSETRDGFDGLDERTRPLVRWTHHD